MIIGKKKNSLIVNIVFYLAIILGLVIVGNSVGVTLGFWSPLDSFRFSRNYNDYIGYIICLTAILAIIYIIKKRNITGMKRAILSLIIGIAILTPNIMSSLGPDVKIPPIHDITTDTDNPPQFMALVGKRGENANTLVYGGPEIAVQQKEAYPDIKPIISTLSPETAYEKALMVAGDMGWEISGADKTALRFEGTATTRWFHFVDDTVVVVSAAPNGSRIDIRSVSRVGRSDIGMNAKRIRKFTELFNN